jgi:hypothetical protein
MILVAKLTCTAALGDMYRINLMYVIATGAILQSHAQIVHGSALNRSVSLILLEAVDMASPPLSPWRFLARNLHAKRNFPPSVSRSGTLRS